MRESPALDVIELLRAKGADVRYHDPFVPIVSHTGYEMHGEPDLDAALAAADCAVVVTDHSCYDWAANPGLWWTRDMPRIQPGAV